MGWDLYASVTVDGNDLSVGEWNCTHNINGMIHAAGCPWSSEDLNGLTSPELLARLEPAVAKMEANPDKYIAMNPANGWGSYELLLPRLRDILACARRFPSATWRASF